MVAPDMAAKGRIDDVHLLHRRLQSVRHAWHLWMSKLALIGLVRNLAAEFGPQGIRFNAICPGLSKPILRANFGTTRESKRSIQIASRCAVLGEPDDFAGLAVFLGSDASKYMTGQALTVCGGSSMWA